MDMSKPGRIIVPGQSQPAAGDGGDKRISVAVVIPSGDLLHANFAMAFAFMAHVTPPHQVRMPIVNVKGSNVAKQRNTGVQKAIELGCDYVLMIDSDMTFPPNALARLLKHQKDVVGGTYARRCQPHDNLAMPKGNAPATVADDAVVEVDALPTGFLLIRASVFAKLKRPYFRFVFTDDVDVIEGEDYYFCRSLREAGIPIHLDVALSHELIHWGEHGIRLTAAQNEGDPRFELLELEGG